ncbi:transglutaminase [Hylemonella gracilis]|uniref:Transglutaminase n=1 Tax=Hylemonella gracilis TaxID=80880 RepID=A0A4P6UM87_9BURK|nr:transglutaminase-like domain-containing protein [Hylemonella gracilis]QBK05225.1 transglutaminase [Hylemonella gracilis]
MKFVFEAPTPLDYFALLVQEHTQASGLSDRLPLLEAAVCLGQDEYPQLDVQQVLADVDALLVRLRTRLPADAPALHKLRLLNHFFFEELGFAGNRNHYHDPDNSYLHRVLERRRGIPVSLAVLWLELAQGLGLDAHGVGFPGHFLVKVQVPTPAGQASRGAKPVAQVVIDPFSGESLSREELLERLDTWRSSAGGPLPYSQVPTDTAADFSLAWHLRTLPARDILARMLRNLKEIHRGQRDWQRLVAVEDRLLVLLPGAWEEYRDRGLARAELGHVPSALSDLETYLARVEDGAGEDWERGAGLHPPSAAALAERQALTERVAALRRAMD